jgi:hypothetical protein
MRPLQGKKHDNEESGLGGTKSNLDRETVMRALREKVAPRKESEASSPTNKEDTDKNKEKETTEKKEVERRKVEQPRDVMALEQLVESDEQAKD